MQAKLAASRGAQLALNWRSEGAKPATDSRECTTDDDEGEQHAAQRGLIVTRC